MGRTISFFRGGGSGANHFLFLFFIFFFPLGDKSDFLFLGADGGEAIGNG